MDKSSDQSSTMQSNCSQTNTSTQSSNTSTNAATSVRRNFKPGRWLKEDDERLRKLVNLYGDSSWSEISKFFQDRTDVQCQQRWDKVVNPELVKGPWTKEVCR